MATYVLSGATSGIGRACAELFAEDGETLVLLGRSPKSLQDLSRELEGTHRRCQVRSFVADFADLDATERMLADVGREFGVIDGIVNCAGVCQKSAVSEITLADWQRIYQINVTVPFLTIQSLLPALQRSERAAVVNVASIAGRLRSISLGAHYSSTKAALIGLTRHLAGELGPKGIRVNATCPSQTSTPMLDEALSHERQRELAKTIPLGRLASAREQAEVISFLLSPKSSYINGAILDVNGGQL